MNNIKILNEREFIATCNRCGCSSEKMNHNEKEQKYFAVNFNRTKWGFKYPHKDGYADTQYGVGKCMCPDCGKELIKFKEEVDKVAREFDKLFFTTYSWQGMDFKVGYLYGGEGSLIQKALIRILAQYTHTLSYKCDDGWLEINPKDGWLEINPKK